MKTTLTFLLSILTGAAATAAPEVQFNRDIRPILSDKCFACHGFDARKREADLRLDQPEAAFEKRENGAAWVPGDPEASQGWQRIISDDPDVLMPPPEIHKALSAEEKKLIHDWITQGAEYEAHWAYVPIAEPRVPRRTHPIDYFVHRRLKEEGMTPAPPADRTDLLRRLSYDLTGLPPTPSEIDAFVNDRRSDKRATLTQIDRLLASPHFGERMAVPWLDLVRFADTVGYHGDQNQRIFPYRDYVIKSLNDNKPFDTFTREQLAGDLLPEPTDEQLIATGFLRLNLMTREGGAQPKEYMAKYAADRVRAIGTVWMGQTTGCAECHDHKFDPITIKDFYSLAAFFDDLRQWGVYSPYNSSPNTDLKGFNNDAPFPPEIHAPNAALLEEIAVLQDRLAAEAAGSLPDALKDPDFQAWVQETNRFMKDHPQGWRTLEPTEVTVTQETPVGIEDDQLVVFSGEPKKKEVATVTLSLTDPMSIRSLRLEVLPHSDNANQVGRDPQGKFALTPVWHVVRAGTNTAEKVEVAWAQADRRTPHRYSNGRHRPRLEEEWRSAPDPWSLPENAQTLPHTAVFHLAQPVELAAGDTLQLVLTSQDVGSVRVSVSPLNDTIPGHPAAPTSLVDALNTPLRQQTPQQQLLLAGHWKLATAASNAVSDKAQALRQRIYHNRAGMARSLAVTRFPEERYRVTRVLPRGNWQDESGEVVRPAVPAFLPQPEGAAEKERLNRLDLANWLVDKRNPLTARHVANRTWQLFFGSGLSGILDDLGNQGEMPTHPELLDWLAADFRDHGWDYKRLVRTIVSSQTYQQAAATRPQVLEKDPYNHLLAQQLPRRLDAEFIRDHALEVAGMLQRDRIGGPSIFPYQPPGYYEPINFPQRTYPVQADDRSLRRGLYMHWQRTFLHPMLANFDAPGREECTAERLPSNSPQQALTLLNDPVFVEAAKGLARRLESEVSGDGAGPRIDRAFRLALGRFPEDVERDGLLQFHDAQLKHFRDTPEEAKEWGTSPESAALGQVCRVILNLHEGITRY